MFDLTFLDILFYLILVDSIGAVWVAFFGRSWYMQYVGFVGRHFPPARGWAILYFTMALLLVLMQQGML